MIFFYIKKSPKLIGNLKEGNVYEGTKEELNKHTYFLALQPSNFRYILQKPLVQEMR